jgi:predicted DNA-binding transcriptional regulator YafY
MKRPDRRFALAERVQARRAENTANGFAANDARPRVTFTAQEVALLATVARWLLEMRLVPLTGTLERVVSKVRSTLSPSGRRELLEHMETLKFVGVPAHTATSEVRQALEEAWVDGATLKIRYAGARETTTRRVRLESIVMARSETLVNAWDLDKNESRQFRLDRIEYAEVDRRR